MTSRKTLRLTRLGRPKKSFISSSTDIPSNSTSLHRIDPRPASKPPQRSALRPPMCPPRSHPEPPLQSSSQSPSKLRSKPQRKPYNVPPPSITSSTESVAPEVEDRRLSVEKQQSNVNIRDEFETTGVKESNKWDLLEIFEEAIDIYLRNGYDEEVACAIFSLLERVLKTRKSVDLCDDKHLVRRFFKSLDSYIGPASAQYSQMFYIMTLMRVLTKFQRKAVKMKAVPRHCRIELVVHGSWLGAKRSSKCNTGGEFEKRYHLLVILNDLLEAEAANQAFQRMWESQSVCYVFGYTPNTEINRGPKTVFIITLSGSEKIAALIRRCLLLEENLSEFEWPVKWPDDAFSAKLEILSSAAVQHGCPAKTLMEFSPFDDTSSDTTEKEEAPCDEAKCGMRNNRRGNQADKNGTGQGKDYKASMKDLNI